MNVLIVEPDPDVAAALVRELGGEAHAEVTASLAEARKHQGDSAPDVVLAAAELFEGPDAEQLAGEAAARPLVLMLDEGQRPNETAAIRRAVGLILKRPGGRDRLAHSLRQAILTWREREGRERAEAALRASEERLRATLESLSDLVIVLDLDTRIIDLHAPLELRDQYGRTDYEGSGLDAILPEQLASSLESAVTQVIVAGVRHEVSLSALTDDGEQHFEARVSPLRADRDVVGATVLLRDVTAQHEAAGARSRLEARLSRAQRLDTVGTLVSGIAHDFNNILMPIMIGVEIVRDALLADSPALDELESIRAAGVRARDLIARLLAFSRDSVPARRAVDLGEVIREALQFVRATLPTTTTLVARLPADAVMVRADSTQMHQVVMNLCVNAHHALEGRPGRIEVSLTTETVTAQAASEHPDLLASTYAVVRVTDEGVGISPDILDRVFEPFFTTRGPSSGTGLGLSVVHGIIQRHEGAIMVNSEVGAGTTLRIFIPLAQALPRARRRSEAERPEPRTAARIFYVDDEPAVVKLGRAALQRAGFVVSTFADAPSALGALEATPDQVDLVITDLTMPLMTGLELARRAKAARADLPVILMTGTLGLEDVGDEVDLVLRKPCGLEELIRAVIQVLEEAKLGDAPGREPS